MKKLIFSNNLIFAKLFTKIMIINLLLNLQVLENIPIRGNRIIEIISNYTKNLKPKNILEIGAGSDYIVRGIDEKNKL